MSLAFSVFFSLVSHLFSVVGLCSARAIERQKKVAENAKVVEAARLERQAWSREQWKKIVEERNAKKLAMFKMIETQSRNWISRENLDERIEQAVDAIMTPK